MIPIVIINGHLEDAKTRNNYSVILLRKLMQSYMEAIKILLEEKSPLLLLISQGDSQSKSNSKNIKRKILTRSLIKCWNLKKQDI